MSLGKILGAGLDDSNHGGDIRGEIIVCTFSYLPEDFKIMKWPNTRNWDVARDWIDHSNNFERTGRDYRYTLLRRHYFKNGSQNLPRVAPYLISDFLRLHDVPDGLKIYLDGRLEKNEKEKLNGFFLYNNVVINNFIKKKKGIDGKLLHKGHCCPNLVYVADVLARCLLENLSFMDGFGDKRFVPVPENLP